MAITLTGDPMHKETRVISPAMVKKRSWMDKIKTVMSQQVPVTCGSMYTAFIVIEKTNKFADKINQNDDLT